MALYLNGISVLSVLIHTWMVILFIQVCEGHPQCLDSRPPFQARNKLSFCRDYEKFGCCTKADDMDLSERFERIERSIPASERSLWTPECAAYAKTFLCQTCSPYAAHIFDSERTRSGSVVQPRAFPALCGSYCTDFYKSCKFLVKYYMDEVGNTYQEESVRLNAAVNQNETQFCSKITVSDMDYCYPQLLSNPILNGNISIEKVTQEGCICVEPYDQHHFRNPIFLLHVKDGSNRLFIGEQIGLVHVMYINGTILPVPFFDITVDIKTTSFKGDERGLLGMEFHPNFTSNGKLYIYYSTQLSDYEMKIGEWDHKIRIEELKVDPKDPNQIDYSYSRVILEVYEPFWNHNGGMLMFGDDGYLYVFIGDGGRAGDPLMSGQDLFSMLGKVHRIDVDKVDLVRGREYSIPPDNPFADGINALPEIYAYGVRNIWRCGKDRGDPVTKHGKGRILCGDVGQGAVEEVNLIEKGANYGWNLKEGTADYCKICEKADPNVTLTDPVAEYRHSVGKSVTGGNFYRGCESPNFNGFYIYGDFMSGKLFRLTEPSNPRQKKWNHKELKMCGSDWCVPPLHNDYSTSIISFGEDEYGEIYMLSTSYASTSRYKGTVYKIVDPMRRGDPEVCKSAGTQTGSGTSPATTSPGSKGTRPTTMGPKTTKTKKPTTTSAPVQAGTTVSPAAPQLTGSSDSVRMMNYLEYFKRREDRNRQRKMEQQYTEERGEHEERKKDLSTNRDPPQEQQDPGLVFHGINVRRCTNKLNWWCSLNRLIPSP